MLTLVLVYQAGEQFSRSAQEAVRSTYIPQIGSTISSGEARSGTYRVALVGHSVCKGELDDTVYVYLEETD
jgi:hypothetical protein